MRKPWAIPKPEMDSDIRYAAIEAEAFGPTDLTGNDWLTKWIRGEDVTDEEVRAGLPHESHVNDDV